MSNRKRKRSHLKAVAKRQKKAYRNHQERFGLTVDIYRFGDPEPKEIKVPVTAYNLYDLLNAGIAVVYNFFKDDNVIIQRIEIKQISRYDEKEVETVIHTHEQLNTLEFAEILKASADEYFKVFKPTNI